jgi:hypothetical protein
MSTNPHPCPEPHAPGLAPALARSHGVPPIHACFARRLHRRALGITAKHLQTHATPRSCANMSTTPLSASRAACTHPLAQHARGRRRTLPGGCVAKASVDMLSGRVSPAPCDLLDHNSLSGAGQCALEFRRHVHLVGMHRTLACCLHPVEQDGPCINESTDLVPKVSVCSLTEDRPTR